MAWYYHAIKCECHTRVCYFDDKIVTKIIRLNANIAENAIQNGYSISSFVVSLSDLAVYVTNKVVEKEIGTNTKSMVSAVPRILLIM